MKLGSEKECDDIMIDNCNKSSNKQKVFIEDGAFEFIGHKRIGG
jgi:hypothetical protein